MNSNNNSNQQFGLPGGLQKNNHNTLGGINEDDDEENENLPLNNVILIGTKKDLCYENLPAGHRAN